MLSLYYLYVPRRSCSLYELQCQKMYLRSCVSGEIQISLCVCRVWSEYSLDVFWIAKNAKFLHADKSDSSEFMDDIYRGLYFLDN